MKRVELVKSLAERLVSDLKVSTLQNLQGIFPSLQLDDLIEKIVNWKAPLWQRILFEDEGLRNRKFENEFSMLKMQVESAINDPKNQFENSDLAVIDEELRELNEVRRKKETPVVPMSKTVRQPTPTQKKAVPTPVPQKKAIPTYPSPYDDDQRRLEAEQRRRREYESSSSNDDLVTLLMINSFANQPPLQPAVFTPGGGSFDGGGASGSWDNDDDRNRLLSSVVATGAAISTAEVIDTSDRLGAYS